MIAKINLGVLKFDLDECSIDKLDKRLDEEIRKKQREAFKKYMEKQDELLTEKNINCPCCRRKMSIKGKQPLKIDMLAGTVTIRRRRLSCLSCGAKQYPFDKHWQTSRKHTLPAVENALYLATDLSYKKASSTLHKLTGAKISHGQIQALAKEEGALAQKELEKNASDLFNLGLDPGEVVKRTKDDTLIIAIDGGNIANRATKSDFEAKVGVIYGIKAKVSKNRFALVDRVGYASLENSFKFGQKLFCLARRHGVMSAGRVLAIGDGAAWIRNLVADMFPRSIYLLDLFHLKRRVSQVLNSDEDESLRQAVYEACQRGQPDRALSYLSTYIALTPEKEEELRKLKGYIYANRVGISNYARSDLFGSGAVEKAVDVLVSRRFKTRGMSWLKPGAAGMLALRLLRFNGEWDNFWKRRFDGLCTP